MFQGGRDRIWPNLIWPSLFGRIWPNRIWPIPHLAKVNWPAFGHPYLAEFGQFLLTEFGQTAFGQFFVFGGGPEGWGPEPRKSGARNVGGPKGGGPQGGGPKGGGPKISRFFFVSHRKIRSGRRGFTRQPENSKRAHLSVLVFKNTTKIQREDFPDREERMKFPAGERKKSCEILGGPGEGRSRGRAVQGKGGPKKGGPNQTLKPTPTHETPL